MKSIRRSALVVLSAVTALALVPGCRHRGQHDPEKAKKHVTYAVNDFLDDLEATPTQRAAALAAKDRLLARALAMHAESPKVARAMLAEWEKDQPSAEAVHALIDERAALMTAFAHAAADELIAWHSTLTPAQRAEVTERVSERLADR